MNNETVYINGNGEQSRDFTFVENAVQANIKALLNAETSSTNKVYNIACGDSISVNDMFNSIRNSLGSNMLATHRAERFGDVKNSKANIDAAKKALGYAPGLNFDEGLKITVDFFTNKK